jgi:hypothetical protein
VYCKNCCKEYNEKMKYCVICGQALAMSADAGTLFENSPETPPETLFQTQVEIQTETSPRELPRTEMLTEVPYEAPSEYTEYTETTEQKPKTKVKIFRSIPAAIASVAIGVCVFALVLSGAVLSAARYVTYPENIAGMVNSIDFLALPLESELLEILPIEERADNLGEAVYTIAEPAGFTEDGVDYIYEKSSFRRELTDIISDYASFLRDGTVPPDLTAEYIKQLFSDNVKYFNEALGENLLQRDIDLAFRNIDLAQAVFEDINIHTISTEYARFFSTARMLISYPTFIAIGAVTLLLILLIARINKKAAPALAVTGAAVIATGVVGATTTAVFANKLTAIPALYEEIVGSALSFVAPPLYIASAGLLFAGIILILFSKISLRKTS